MKSFYAAMLVFAALLLLIFYNTLFIHRTASEMELRIDAVVNAQDALSAVQELECYWQKKRTPVRLSLHGSIILSIDERIGEIRWAVEQEKTDELALAVRQLKDAVRLMCKSHGISPDTLL